MENKVENEKGREIREKKISESKICVEKCVNFY